MTVTKLRDVIYDIIQDYFAGAIVEWGELPFGTVPTSPFLRLKFGSITRPQHFITETQNNASRSLIPSSVTLSVELFTHGEERKDEDGDSYFVNTATADMIDFVNYMVSEYADEMYERLDISVRPEGDVLDTTAVRDSDYQYRAKQDFIVSFMDESRGFAGISRDNWAPTPSGGGTEELANQQIMDVDPEKLNIENSSEEE